MKNQKTKSVFSDNESDSNDENKATGEKALMKKRKLNPEEN